MNNSGGRSFTHRPALDGLRGLAVAVVVVFHLGHLRGGYLGVDAFFVLSGFLITSLLLSECEATGRVDIVAFWGRRARRLLPAVFLLLAGVVVYAVVFAAPIELANLRGDGLATLFYVQNWHAVFSHADYFALFASPSLLQHTWSLAIEEQFYVVWPVVFAILGRVARSASKPGRPRAVHLSRLILWTATVCAIGSYGAAWYLASRGATTRVYYGTDTRAGAMMLGAAVAAMLSIRPTRVQPPKRLLDIAGVLVVAVLGWVWANVDGGSPNLYRGVMALCAVSVVVLIIVTEFAPEGWLARVFSVHPLRVLGRLSYGIYLFHWPLFVVLDHDRTGLDGWSLVAVRLGTTMIVASLSFRFVELPIRASRFRWTKRPRIITATASGLALILTATLIASTAASGDGRGAFLANAVPARSTRLWRTVLREWRRESAATTGLRRVLVLGDSVAGTLGLDTSLVAKPNATHAAFGIILCSLIDGDRVVDGRAEGSDPLCAHRNELFGDVIEAFRPSVVVLMAGPWEMFDRVIAGSLVTANSRVVRAALSRAVHDLETRVAAIGARLVIANTPCFNPHQVALPGHRKVWRDRQRIADMNSSWYEVARRELPTLRVLDTGALLCPHGVPVRNLDGEVARPDGLHFSRTGAHAVWRWIDQQLVGIG